MKELAMKRTMTVTIVTDGDSDRLGNGTGDMGNVRTVVTFSGKDSFITCCYGGRDGSSLDSISLESLISIAERVGKED